MLTFTQYLKEAFGSSLTKLTPAQLAKPNSSHPDKPNRIDILIDAIRNGIELELADNKKKIKIANIIDNINAAQQFKIDSKAFTLILSDGTEISSSDIGKGVLFGGGGGAGGGTIQTAIVESTQCYYCAAMVKYGIKDFDFFTADVFASVKGRVNTGKITFKQVTEETPADWMYSGYVSAKHLIQKGYINKSHTFHRDSKEMKKIYMLKNEAFANNDFPSMSNDKWNPGDIWAIEDGVSLEKELNTESIKGLNDSIAKSFLNRKIVGISLKLIKDQGKIKLIDQNVDDSPVDQHKVTAVKASSNRGTFWSSKSCNVIADNSIDLRLTPNSYLSVIKAEIQLKTARGGGASWGVLQGYAKSKLNEKLPDNKSLVKFVQKIENNFDKSKKELLEFYKMAVIVEGQHIGTYDTFIDELSKKDIGWFHAKYSEILLCYYIVKHKGTKADDFITSIINYAASKAEESSAYVKVYE